MKDKDYVPDTKDIIWVNFNPSKGSEQKGRRPALVLTTKRYNQFGLCYIVPITSKIKGYNVEVELAEQLVTSGVILTNQMLAIDFQARQIEYIETLDQRSFDVVKSRLRTILQL